MARKILYVVAFVGLSLALLAYAVPGLASWSLQLGRAQSPSMVKPLRHSRYLTM